MLVKLDRKPDWEQTSCYLCLGVFVLCPEQNAPLKLRVLAGCPEAAVFGQGRIARPAHCPALHLLLICYKESVYL